MELKGKHIYGVGAAVVGVVAIVFAPLYWLINQKLDTTVQATLALGLIGLAVFAWLEIDLITRILRTRQARYGAETLAFVLLFLIVVGLVNYIFTREKLKTQWDLTEAKENSLAPESVKVLSELKEPVHVIGFYSSQGFGRESAEELLRKFRDKSGGKLGYEFVDPVVKRALAQQYGITRDGTLVVVRGEQHEQAKYADEASLINAIVRINNPTAYAVYFVTGHGEKSVDESGDNGLSQIKTYLEGVNIQLKTLNVLSSIPEGAAAIVIAGPSTPYSAAEVDAIGKYLAGGGKAIFMIEPSLLGGVEQGQTDLLVDYLSKNWGMTLRDDLIIDNVQYVPGTDPSFPVTVAYTASPLISEEIQEVASFFPSSRSIQLADTAPTDVTLTSVIKTGPNAWGETAFDSLSNGQLAPEESDAQGELTMAATAENATTGARVIVFGDSDFAANLYWPTGAANAVVLLNAVKWTTSEEDLISLTPRPSVTHTLDVFSTRDLIVILLLSCLLPPFVVVVGAVGVWWSRRRNA